MCSNYDSTTIYSAQVGVAYFTRILYRQLHCFANFSTLETPYMRRRLEFNAAIIGDEVFAGFLTERDRIAVPRDLEFPHIQS